MTVRHSRLASIVIAGLLFAGSAEPAFALPPVFTGDAPADFVDPSAVFYLDAPFPDVGMPKPPFALGAISGWDMEGVYLQYDALTDTMYVGIDCYTICGDADDDGFPGGTSATLAALFGTDAANLSSTESFAVVFDTTQVFGCPPDGAGDVVAGTASVVGANINNFDIYEYAAGCPDGFFGSGCPFTSTGAFPGDSVIVAPVTLSLFANPSVAAPDLEFAVSPFSQLPGFTFVPGGAFAVELNLFGGSFEDAGIGEDKMVDLCFEVTTTTTSTTTTTLCECGDGIVSCDEACDPLGLEICSNETDDDGDGLIDCADPDCSEATGPTCTGTCMEETVECKPILDDPAVIYLGDSDSNRLGYFSLHGRVLAAPDAFNPSDDGFTIQLSNANGVIYSGTLLPGDLAPAGVRNGLPTRYKFVDKSARTLGAGSTRNGIFRVSMRFRKVEGQPSFTVKLKIFSYFTDATEAQMTTQWYGVDGIGYLTADWTKTNRGWKLTLENFRSQN